MTDIWNITLFKIQDTPISPLNLIIFVTIFLISYFLAKTIKAFIMKINVLRRHVSLSASYTLARCVYYIILLTGFYIALTTVGINLTGIAVVIGALNIGIGFGLQSVFKDFISGIIILVEKKVRIGDLVQLESGDMGHVKEVHMRSTLLHTLDNRNILIPNTDIVSKKVVNWTLGSDLLHRYRIPFTVDRKTDKETIRKIALEMAKASNKISKASQPEVWLKSIGEVAQDFELIVWLEKRGIDLSSESIIASCLWELDSAFAVHGIPLMKAARPIERAPALDEL